MTEILNDTVQPTMTIDGEPWLISEAKVELSLNTSPNYVDIIKAVPDTPGNRLYQSASNLIGTPFELRVDTDLISKRETNATEDTLLFRGAVANLSPLGDGAYEGTAYDASQQGLETETSDEGGESLTTSSLLNEEVYIPQPLEEYDRITSGTGFSSVGITTRTISASDLADRVARKLSIEEVDNQITDGGVTRSGPTGSVTGAEDTQIAFNQAKITISKALERITELTDSTFWFDKRGVFHIGVPNPVKHEIQYVTDASDGITTPAYQSVRVIGSGIASEEGFARNHMRPEERIVAEWIIANPVEKDSFPIVKFSETPDRIDSMPEPVFTYRNNEISTQDQADKAASNIAKDIAKQQAQGKVTVTGFPEIEPLDAIIMPQAQDPDAPNYNPRQPMGGTSYSVYKVVHKLNGSDGFKTDIHVAGLVGASRVILTSDEIAMAKGEPKDSDGDGVPDSVDTRQGYGL